VLEGRRALFRSATWRRSRRVVRCRAWSRPPIEIEQRTLIGTQSSATVASVLPDLNGARAGKLKMLVCMRFNALDQLRER
jgi:hypothetical protein